MFRLLTNLKIKYQLFLLVGLFFLYTVIMQTYLISNTNRILYKKITTSTESAFNYIEMEMLNFFKNIESTCNYINSIPSVQQFLNTDDPKDIYIAYQGTRMPMSNLLVTNSSILNIILATNNHTISFNDINLSIDIEELKNMTLKKNETVYTHALAVSNTGSITYFAAVHQLNKIVGLSSKYFGNTIIILNSSYFNLICSKYSTTQNSRTFILNEKNEILGKSNIEPDNHLESKIRSMNLNPGSSDKFKIDKTNFISHIRSLGETGWKVVSITPHSEYYSELNTMKYINIAIFIIALAILIFFSLRIITNITQPVKSLLSTMESVKRGKLNERSPILPENEIGKLSTHFNDMMAEVYQLNRTIFGNQQKLYELKLANKDARLLALQSQINPHFLYNTLACIQGIALHYNISEISTIATALARILRYSIRESDFVLIGAELENLENYVAICRIMLKDKFDYTIDVDPDIIDCNINKLILQPIVENAVNHGFMKKSGKGSLLIKGYKTEKYICFEIIDNGAGISNDRLIQLNRGEDYSNEELSKDKKNGNGIGIKNVRQRLALCYDSNYILNFESQPGIQTKVTVQIPQMKGDPNADWAVYR